MGNSKGSSLPLRAALASLTGSCFLAGARKWMYGRARQEMWEKALQNTSHFWEHRPTEPKVVQQAEVKMCGGKFITKIQTSLQKLFIELLQSEGPPLQKEHLRRSPVNVSLLTHTSIYPQSRSEAALPPPCLHACSSAMWGTSPGPGGFVSFCTWRRRWWAVKYRNQPAWRNWGALWLWLVPWRAGTVFWVISVRIFNASNGFQAHWKHCASSRCLVKNKLLSK